MNRGYHRPQEDRSTCTFYTKIGACRHGEKCSRKHIKPTTSRTVILSNLYENPRLNKNEDEFNPKQLQEYFDQFFKDVFIRFSGIGKVVAMVVCENENNHLNGNVYVRFSNTQEADVATEVLNQDWFNGRPVHCDLSPVENFVEANCRAYDDNSCTRGDHCNFMHVRRPTKAFEDGLFRSQQKSFLLRKLEEARKQLAPKAEPEKAPVTAEASVEEPPKEEAQPESATTMIQQLFA
ncbi:RNA-binding domain-containing protein [Suhomyces tanzawaensis NRRL Y-17324]|uniref:RNA-binding domain-containing protein n=1 Tax=Suhomyces tanzawaensis NRRL Y-17324 TaxID=984487 RepID=A0A1E4SN34_9ASCO|nr:RNA-binding domain-containing protein [Suhomyces tanzawaensis NRRL Y-17324]ODV80931.1 RNA-binding domain-containing protein [Suhomyces tanzawaensis NRRL Y-17324]